MLINKESIFDGPRYIQAILRDITNLSKRAETNSRSSHISVFYSYLFVIFKMINIDKIYNVIGIFTSSGSF
jgi:hypothetical protein